MSGEEIELRPATPEEAGPIFAMMEELYREEGYGIDRDRARAALAALLADGSLGLVLLAEVAGAPAGYVALTLGFSLEYGGRDAFVDELFVRAPYRGRGIGSSLLDRGIERCAELGVRALHLEVERRNVEGQALYRRRGFVDNDRRLLTLRLAED